MKKLSMTLFSLCLASALTVGASAAEPLSYDVDGPGDPEYGKPTSVEVVYTADGGAMKNEDVSKNAALIPPAFGSPSADALHTGIYLTPNLAPNGQPTGGAVINGTGSAVMIPGSPVPSAPTSGSSGTASTGYTEVTDDLYYKGGHLGTLKIPAIDLTVKVYEGTGSSTLAKGAGHFEETSIWDGNVALAAHNRGVNNHFGKIHTLDLGDRITLTTKNDLTDCLKPRAKRRRKP
ncbi:sortase domain-bontaining protein [uncultured Dysosmobacter sp.]|uniref:sortase domain-containing protein n=1 Tax=uncultured Dysosmobacter sp. TaxID=2591384 RepID=UPI00260E1282|nr:sortase [uncultured Dysosmobacter sp.]